MAETKRTRPSADRTPTIKASFNLPEDELEELREVAAARNLTVTQVLRQAIADELFLLRQVDENNKVLIETPQGDTRQMLFTR
jgi:hypothetical protein